MAEHRRLFFALPLPAEIQQQIIRWRAGQFPETSGRPVAAANLHLTLAFLGEVSREKQQALCRLAGRIRQPGFTLRLDDAGQWLRSGVVWAGPRQAPRDLLQLADKLRAQAARSGCYPSSASFHPHVTLYRNALHPITLPPPGFSYEFRVDTFTLYQSLLKQGKTHYQPLQHWPLLHKEA